MHARIRTPLILAGWFFTLALLAGSADADPIANIVSLTVSKDDTGAGGGGIYVEMTQPDYPPKEYVFFITGEVDSVTAGEVLSMEPGAYTLSHTSEYGSTFIHIVAANEKACDLPGEGLLVHIYGCDWVPYGNDVDSWASFGRYPCSALPEDVYYESEGDFTNQCGSSKASVARTTWGAVKSLMR